MTVDNQQTPWWETKDSVFFEPTATDDFLHPEANARVEGDSVSETQYFGFNIPDKRIYGLCYLWHHPISVCSSVARGSCRVLCATTFSPRSSTSSLTRTTVVLHRTYTMSTSLTDIAPTSSNPLNGTGFATPMTVAAIRSTLNSRR